MSTRPTSHTTTSPALTTTPAGTTSSSGTTTSAPAGTTPASLSDTSILIEGGQTAGLSEAMRLPRSSTLPSLADSIMQPVETYASRIALKETKAPAFTAPLETKTGKLSEPATWSQAHDLIDTDVTVTDHLVPAVLLRLFTRPMSGGGVTRWTVVRLEDSPDLPAGLFGEMPRDVQGGYITLELPLSEAALRPAALLGRGRLLTPKQADGLAIGTKVEAARALVKVLGHESLADEPDARQLLVGSTRYLPRLDELHNGSQVEPDENAADSAPEDGIWKYRVTIDELEIRLPIAELDTKNLLKRKL